MKALCSPTCPCVHVCRQRKISTVVTHHWLMRQWRPWRQPSLGNTEDHKMIPRSQRGEASKGAGQGASPLPEALTNASETSGWPVARTTSSATATLKASHCMCVRIQLQCKACTAAFSVVCVLSCLCVHTQLCAKEWRW